RSDALGWKESKRITGDVVGELRKLKSTNGPPLQVWGSHGLMQTLIGAELIDELRFWIIPVVVGQGKRLFENGVPPRAFTLVSTSRTPSGVIMNTYRPAGPIPKE